MEKFFRLLYYYCLGAFVIGVIYMSVMLFMAPRQDALKRGFIPCTETLVINITSCEAGKISCPLKYLWQDLKCNTKVVLNGFGAWIKKEQKTPWDNYLFTPVAQAEIDKEMPYKGSVLQDMDDLEKTRKFFEEKQAELEAAKNRKLELDENVIMSDPENEIPSADAKKASETEKLSEEEKGDISQEVFEENEWKEDVQNAPERQEPQKDVIENIKQKTAEQLSKEEINYDE
ncbi:MAG: hypothetical protein IJ532_00295 [Alphaproteobacteria bacterium]|nr:hypothetical protein [Alphaproteobacteria bacterium]